MRKSKFSKEFEIYFRNEKKLKELFDKKRVFLEFEKGEVYIKPFDIPKLEGFEVPDNYPECCGYHKQILSYANGWFNRFPNCCERHKKYQNLEWFDKKNYTHIPEKIRLSLLYTEFFIKIHINDVDWYKQITDYLDFIIRSFGLPEVGADRYELVIEHYIKYSLESESGLTSDKRQRILEYLLRKNQDIDQQERADLNVLMSIFDKWIRTIPNLAIFGKIKNDIAGSFPLKLILHSGEYNSFLGETRYKSRTRGELIQLLVDITRRSLLTISNNAESLRDDNKITYLQVIQESHRLKQNKLLDQYCKAERKYIKLIKQWLINESHFFKNVEELKKNNATLLRSSNIKNVPDIIEVKKLIGENKLTRAFSQMEHWAYKNNEKYFGDQVILQKARHKDITSRLEKGVIKYEDFALEINKIRSAIIELLDMF